MRASTLAMFMTVQKSCKISVCQEQSVKVNAFYYVVTLMEWLTCPEQVRTWFGL